MALIKAKTVAEEMPFTYTDPVASKIQRRRYQILVHSLLYYDLDTNLISDHQWQDWAQDLVKLQEENPDVSSRVIFADAFKNFDGSSGFDLPYRDGQIVRIAIRLLEGQEKPATIDREEALWRLRHEIQRLPEEWESYKKKSHSVKPAPLVKKEVKQVEQKPRKGLFSVSRK